MSAPLLTGLCFGECPRWHKGRLWVSDFYDHQVLSLNEDGSDVRIEVEVPNQPGGLGWLPDGSLLVVSMKDQRVLRVGTHGDVHVHADLAGTAVGYLNDMAVDDAGVAFVGEFGFDVLAGEQPRAGSVHRVEPDGRSEVGVSGVWFPNGCGFTSRGELVVVETFANRVSVFAMTADRRVSQRRDWVVFGPGPDPSGPGPAAGDGAAALLGDGACLDAEDGLWVADPMARRVIRVLEGGEITAEVRTARGAYACALGGRDGRTLFVCASPTHDPGEAVRLRAGAIEVFRVAVPAS